MHKHKQDLTLAFKLFLSNMLCNNNVYVQVLQNSNVIIDLNLSPLMSVQCITRSRAVIVQLTVGDTLRVTMPTVGCTYDDSYHFNSFTGFRIA